MSPVDSIKANAAGRGMVDVFKCLLVIKFVGVCFFVGWPKHGASKFQLSLELQAVGRLGRDAARLLRVQILPTLLHVQEFLNQF